MSFSAKLRGFPSAIVTDCKVASFSISYSISALMPTREYIQLPAINSALVLSQAPFLTNSIGLEYNSFCPTPGTKRSSPLAFLNFLKEFFNL